MLFPLSYEGGGCAVACTKPQLTRRFGFEPIRGLVRAVSEPELGCWWPFCGCWHAHRQAALTFWLTLAVKPRRVPATPLQMMSGTVTTGNHAYDGSAGNQ